MALALLNRARAAGLDVALDAGGALRVRGPRRLSALAAEVLAHRAAIIALLESSITSTPSPSGPGEGELEPHQFLSTIAAQHCHPAVLAERLGMPLEDVLRRLEASPWSGHGARHRARLGLKASTGPRSTGDMARPAPPEHHLHFPAP